MSEPAKQTQFMCALTRRAISTFSFGMFVHVKCMHVSSPIRLWHVLTISDVRSDVRPPAFLKVRIQTHAIDEFGRSTSSGLTM